MVGRPSAERPRPFERIAGKFLIVLYALSGLTSLAYEVLWTRVLSLQFGVSIFSVVAVVVAFMGGLGGGSMIGIRLARRTDRPLRTFALLEGGIAVFALAMPWAFMAADGLLSGLAARTTLQQWYILLGTASVLFLTLPALALGIGFPLVLEVARGRNIPLHRVYGWNTLGGAMGALLPLALLPAFGWLTSTQLVAGVGLVVAVGAYLLAREYVDGASRSGLDATREVPVGTLLAYAGIGAASLMLEIGWIRLYGMVLLRTEYVMGILLAVFLIGIGAGSLLARFVDGKRGFEILPVCASLAGLISLQLLPIVSRWVDGRTFGSLASALVQQGTLLALVTLPVTLLLGMWLPLLTARVGGGSAVGARLYAVNSLGAALGVLLAGVVFIPTIGTAATTALASLLVLCFGLTWMRALWRWPALLVVAAGAWLSRDLPPIRELQPRSMPEGQDLYVHEDAVTITHVVDRGDGQRVLLDDLQRLDATTDQWDVEEQKAQSRLPLLLHPGPRSVLFLGLGTGISAAGSLPFPSLDRYAVEISHGAIDASRRWFAPVNGGVVDRMTIFRDDAVRFLRADTAQYDVIIGDLFHPDLAGRSALLSRQQFERARSRLAPGGLFVQWLAVHQFDPEALEVVLRTFSAVFPDATTFLVGFRLALVGGITPDASTVVATVARMSVSGAAQATGGEGPWTWLSRYWGPIQVGPGPVQDEWAPRIEFRLARAHHANALDAVAVQSYLLERRPSAAAAAHALRLPTGDFERFEQAYLATTALQQSSLAAADPSRVSESRQLMLQANRLNPADYGAGMTIAETLMGSVLREAPQGAERVAALRQILEFRPDHAPALRELWQFELRNGRLAAADAYLARLRQASPLDPAVTSATGE